MPFLSAVALFLFVSSAAAQDNHLTCRTDFCVLTFITNAGWEQRVKIVGRGAGGELTLTGRGEGITHYSAYVPRGLYSVTAWHNKPKVGWALSDLVVRAEDGTQVARADDGGTASHRSKKDDNDYNDAVVRLAPVR